MGRPTILTAEVIANVAKALVAGNYLDTALAYAGVGRAAGRRWLKRGRDELKRVASNPRAKVRQSEVIYIDFVDAVEKAQADAEVRNVATIQKASAESWQASAWWLERHHPSRWAKTTRVEHDVKSDTPTQIVVDLRKPTS